MDTLSSGCLTTEITLRCIPLSVSTVSGFVPYLGFSLSALPGQRGVTPAFGYDTPHPGARGTSTLLISALPSAHYRLLRPRAPHRYSHYIHRLPLSQHRQGSPVFILVRLPLRVTPVTPEVHLSVLAVMVRIDAPVFPAVGKSRQLHRVFRGYIWVRSRCGPQVCSALLQSLCQET